MSKLPTAGRVSLHTPWAGAQWARASILLSILFIRYSILYINTRIDNPTRCYQTILFTEIVLSWPGSCGRYDPGQEGPGVVLWVVVKCLVSQDTQDLCVDILYLLCGIPLSQLSQIIEMLYQHSLGIMGFYGF